MKQIIFIFNLFLIINLSYNHDLKAQQTEKIYACEPQNHSFIAQGHNLFELLLKAVENNEVKTYAAIKDVLNITKSLSKQEIYSILKTSVDDNNNIIPAKGNDFQIFYIHSQNKKSITLDIEFFSYKFSKPIQLRFDFNEIVNYLENKFQKSLHYKGIQNIEAAYLDLEKNKIEMSLAKALIQKKYKVLSEQTDYNFSESEQLKLKKINKIPSPIWLEIDKNRYTTIVNYTIDSRLVNDIITTSQSDSLWYKLYQLDTLAYLNNNVAYGDFMKLVVLGIQKGQLMPQKMSMDTYQNAGAKREVMTEEEFMGFLNPLKPENLMMRLQIAYFMNGKTTQTIKDITHISLIIPKGSTSLTALGSLAFAEIPFVQVDKYINEIYTSSKGQKGAWASVDKPNEKMSFTQALKQGKYFGYLTKYTNLNDDELKSIFFNLEENESLTEKEKEQKFILFIKEYQKSFSLK